MISFKTTKADGAFIVGIVARAVQMAKQDGDQYEFMDAEMDITACHANGTPLKLGELLHAEDFDFAHDVFGIRRHLNRKTGQLEDCFLPRYAA